MSEELRPRFGILYQIWYTRLLSWTLIKLDTVLRMLIDLKIVDYLLALPRGHHVEVGSRRPPISKLRFNIVLGSKKHVAIPPPTRFVIGFNLHKDLNTRATD